MTLSKRKLDSNNESQADAEQKESFGGTDSLAVYFKEMSETALLSPEEEAEALREYNSRLESIWLELCLFAFVANEYINVLGETTADNISEKFMILSVLAENKKRHESMILDFSMWRSEIELAREKCYGKKSGDQTDHNKNRKVLQSLLKRYRPQNSYIQEWSEVAQDYERELRQKEEKGGLSPQKILSRIQLTKDEFFSSMKRIAKYKSAAEDIRKKFLEGNLRLVISAAKHFQNRGASLNDLIQEGNIGLMKALDKFDCRLGNKFSTYAIWWIKHSISKGLAEQSRTIRIPTHMIASINKMKMEEQLFIQEKGRAPEPEELAAILDMPRERVRALQRMSEQPISLQAPVGEEGDATLEELLEDETSESPVKLAASSLLKEKIKEVLDMLSERERLVVSMRFGLNDYDQKTLAEISLQFGVSKERVRQIERNAIEKLRHPSRRKYLEGYF